MQKELERQREETASLKSTCERLLTHVQELQESKECRKDNDKSESTEQEQSNTEATLRAGLTLTAEPKNQTVTQLFSGMM